MRRVINILIVLFLIDVLTAGALWFEYSALAAKKGEETNLRQGLVDESRKSLELAGVRRMVTQATNESSVLGKYFYDPGEESQIKFVSQIESLGTTTSGVLVETRSLDLSSGARPSFHGEFALSGTWPRIYHFLRLIETFPARIVINRFSVSSNDNGALSGTMSLDLVSLNDN